MSAYLSPNVENLSSRKNIKMKNQIKELLIYSPGFID